MTDLAIREKKRKKKREHERERYEKRNGENHRSTKEERGKAITDFTADVAEIILTYATLPYTKIFQLLCALLHRLSCILPFS
jgi:hypothetical protein